MPVGYGVGALLRRAMRGADARRVEVVFWFIVILLVGIFTVAYLLSDSPARESSTAPMSRLAQAHSQSGTAGASSAQSPLVAHCRF